MSGLEALSVACNVTQVISFAHESVEFCKNIMSVASLQEFTAQLQTHFQLAKPKTANEKQLADIAEKCNIAARALKDEVSFLGSHHAKGDLRTALSVVIKTNWRRSRLERLERSLCNHQQTMESYLLARICTQTDAIKLQQSQDFEKLGSDIRLFIRQYASGHTRLADLIKPELVSVKADIVRTTLQSEESIKKHLETVAASIEESITGHITMSNNEIMRKMDRSKIQSHVKSSTKGMQDRFLETSSFEHTFEWIFNSDTNTNCTQLWDDFHDWLRSDTNIYWIRGKPGSGKSILVKYLVNDPSTEAALNTWNENSAKNIKGFLCSILHQAFVSAKESMLVNSIMNTSDRFLLKREVSDWGIQELKDVSFAVLGSDVFPVCIFLDGLDEICEDDGQLSLLKLVDELRTLPEVKVCVASRPEPILQSSLYRHQELRLQDLTRNDMLAFATEGVFLWLRLVLRSLIRGTENDDGDEDEKEEEHVPFESISRFTIIRLGETDKSSKKKQDKRKRRKKTPVRGIEPRAPR
ncbi:hypothetical protein F4811DRAFT_572861 [Daldinia bambusicola]|nr:hypothetical protein F4811DRAFT_572861 [Daldinia bambusicola]